MEIDDTSYQTLFWSLMNAIEDIDEAIDVWEVFEIAGLQLEEEQEKDNE